MLSRSSRKLLFTAAFLLLAGFIPQPEAQAKSMRCCSGNTCKCCVATNDAPQQTNMITGDASASTGGCSCSSGPNPFGRDVAPATPYLEFQKKRHLHTIAFSTPYYRLTPAISATIKDKPPPRSIQCLYLLKNSLRI